MNFLQRIARASRGISSELGRNSRALGPDRGRYATDILASRVLALTRRIPSYDQIRTVTSRDGSTIHYRRNRGDIQSVREIYLDDSYRLPSTLWPRTFIDLGANIGLVSTLYSRRYSLQKVIAVEPVPGNVLLLGQNMAANSVPAQVISAAVGPRPGRARFVVSAASNLGHIGDEGELVVDVVTMPSLLKMLGGDADLVKLDIEGGEGPLLLESDVSWLARVGAVIAEIHPVLVDYEQIVRIFTERGFTYHPSGSLWPTSMDMFIRSPA
jgi:FkbM family methyltransferase